MRPAYRLSVAATLAEAARLDVQRFARISRSCATPYTANRWSI